MKISVIVPALNEEVLLPELLGDLQSQRLDGYEMIIADAGSTDRTREVAQEYGARVVEGGMPAVGRNSGAQAANGEFLFFLDADVRVPGDFLPNAYREIEKRYLDLATCEILPLSDHPMDKFMHDFANFAVKLGQFTDPHAPGCCILVSKRLYNRIGGFDERLKMGEDHNFVKRASEFRPLRVLNSTQVSVSVRRLEKEGRANLISKYLTIELYRTFLGEVKDDIVEYDFGNFNTVEQMPEEAKVKEGQRLIERINQEYQDWLSSITGDQRLADISREGLANIKEEFEEIKDFFESMFRG